ncbi:Uncharacterised protein [Mycobacteroides abscessus subsp. abscessus]|nr:Uncharacterised protein [Mycobacteroides abscessus subsp. abscessus]
MVPAWPRLWNVSETTFCPGLPQWPAVIPINSPVLALPIVVRVQAAALLPPLRTRIPEPPPR